VHPVLIHFGGFSIKTYGFFIAIGFLVGISFALREAKRLNYDSQLILDLSFYMIVGAIIGSRLFYVLTHMSYYRQNPFDIFKVWQGGLTFFGGFILAVTICVWIIKKHQLGIWKIFDIFAPFLAVGVFFGRLGCFFAGCCYGKPCSLPWAVTFNNPQSLAILHVPLHPTQLYSAAGALITFLILFAWRKRKSFDGQLTLMWIFLYSCFRLIIEMLRGDVRGDLLFGQFPASQILSGLLAIGSLILFPVLRARSKKK
jgi:phosphatidylglycerol:prolipoprotein diacylglycerol transferase